LPKKTFKAIKETNNHAILQVKENQKNLLENCRQIAQDQASMGSFAKQEKAHGRIEFRNVEIFSVLNTGVSLDEEWREYAETLLKVTRERDVFNTRTKQYDKSNEISFYLATFSNTAKGFFYAVRSHWGIENSNHHVRDVSMEEDQSRIRKNPENMAKLRSFSLNMMRKKNVTNIKNETYKNVLNIDKLLKKYNSII